MRFDRETRARIVREWITMPIGQKTFCAARSISPRTLRAWCQQAREEEGQVEPARHEVLPLHAAMEALQARLARLEALVDATLASAAACRAAADEQGDAYPAVPARAPGSEPEPGLSDPTAPEPSPAPPISEAPAQPLVAEQSLAATMPSSGSVSISSRTPRKKSGSFFADFEMGAREDSTSAQ